MHIGFILIKLEREYAALDVNFIQQADKFFYLALFFQMQNLPLQFTLLIGGAQALNTQILQRTAHNIGQANYAHNESFTLQCLLQQRVGFFERGRLFNLVGAGLS